MLDRSRLLRAAGAALRALGLLGLLMADAAGQPLPQFSSRQPDCQIFFSFSSAGNSGQHDNRWVGCTTWTVTYTSSGFTALSLTVQSAPDASGTPGAWVAWAGTILSGVNPNTAITQATAELTGYYPWVRVNLAGLTGAGTVAGVVYGYRTQPLQTVTTLAAGEVTSVGADAHGSPPTKKPVTVAGWDGTNVRRLLTDTNGALALALYNGSTWDRAFACTNQAAITLSAAGDTEIIAASGSTTIRLCHLSVSWDTATGVDVKLTSGTGSNCGTGNAAVSGLYKGISSIILQPGADAAIRGPAGGAVCLNQSAAIAAGGIVVYARF